MLKKRSFSLAGHRTSVALEAEFWAVLEAEAAGGSLAALVARIDAGRGLRERSERRVVARRRGNEEGLAALPDPQLIRQRFSRITRHRPVSSP